MTESDNTNGIVMTNSTAGEYSDYTFNFSSDRTILATDEIYIKFPKAYDAYLGKAYIKYQEGDLRKTYFIDCTNTILNSKIECSVDRWYVRIFNLQEVVADTLVSITIKDVKNPAATSQTDDF